jgi:hypothetical protein
MRTWLWMAMALVLALATTSRAEEAAMKRDRQGPVTVTVTLMEATATGIKARVVLDTHAGSLDGIALERAVSLRRPGEGDVAPVAVEPVTASGHHRQALVVFSPATGATEVWIVVKNVGGVGERMFVWSLPLAR